MQLVTLPTQDQFRSPNFYQSLGFEVRVDIPWGEGHRWIEVYPPDTATGLVLMPAGPDRVGIRTGSSSTPATSMWPMRGGKQLGVDVDPAVARSGHPSRSASAPLTRQSPNLRCFGSGSRRECAAPRRASPCLNRLQVRSSDHPAALGGAPNEATAGTTDNVSPACWSPWQRAAPGRVTQDMKL